MKTRMILVTLMIAMMSATVFAANGNMGTTANNNAQQTQYEPSEVKGLEKAKIQVQSEQALKRIEAAMEKIQERTRERLNKMEGVEFSEEEDGEVLATGKVKARFLGILPWQKTMKYRVSAEGDVEYIPGALDGLSTFEVIEDETV